jgi:hypothetical protein
MDDTTDDTMLTPQDETAAPAAEAERSTQPELAYEPADVSEAAEAAEPVALAGLESDAVEAPAESEPEMPAESVAVEPEPEPEVSLDEMVEALRSPESGADAESTGGQVEAAAEEEPTQPEPDAETVAPAPAPAPAPAVQPVRVVEVNARPGSQVPFWAYAVVWTIFAGAMLAMLWDAPTVGNSLYPVFMWVGVGLTAAGPLLGLFVWLFTRDRDSAAGRRGLAQAAFLRAAVATVFGVVAWLLALAALDLHRAGLLG